MMLLPETRPLFLAAVAATSLNFACGGTAPPPVEPHAKAIERLSEPPWRQRVSAAEGYEAHAGAAPPILIRGATLMLATGATIQRGDILLEKGKIAAVSEKDIPAPPGATIIDGAGKFVTPGIIDTHSHLGVYPMPDASAHSDGNEMTDPVTPQAQSVDAFWPQDPAIERAVAGGVTTIQVLPGSGNLIGGRAVTIKLRAGRAPREMHFEGAPDGLKMACGENPKRVYGSNKRMPMSRMGNLALQRAAFLKASKLSRDWAKWAESEGRRRRGAAKKQAAYEAAKEERARRAKWCSGPDADGGQCARWRAAWAERPLEEPEGTEPIAPPDRDPGIETLAAAMEGRVLVHIHCYRADDMMAMLALADEVGFKVRSFHHALEAYKIRDTLAERGISVSTWADWWGFKMEAYDGIPENIALIQEAKGRPIVHTDSPEGIQRMNQEAAKALASGRRAGVALTEEQAIRWLTMEPAWALGVDQRTGSLEVGKDADVVLWNMNPFSVYAYAEKVWIDGALRYTHGDGPWSDFETGQDMRPMQEGSKP